MKVEEIKLAFESNQVQLAAADNVKQLRDGATMVGSGVPSLKTVQSNIAKGASQYEKALLDATETIKKMDALPKDLINMQVYNSLKSYTQSIPKKISELRALGGRVQDLVSAISGFSTL